MRMSCPPCVGLLAVAVVSVAQPALASEFYAVTTSGALRRFDMSAHTVTHVSNLHIGPTTLTHGFTELTSDAAGNLFAIRSYQGDGPGFPPPQFNEIIRITNPALGNSLLNASFGDGLGNVHHGVAWDPATTAFYTVKNSNGFLGALDINTAAFTPVSGVGHGSPWFTDALAVNPVDGQAYAIVDRGIAIFGTADFTLLGMNLATGQSTTIGSLGLGSSAFIRGGLRFDETGAAYTVDPASGNVYTINLATGAASFLFAGGPDAIGTTGLALIVPAPAGLGLLALGSVFAARRRRSVAG